MDKVENMTFPNNSLVKRDEPNEPVDSRTHRAPVAKGKATIKKKSPVKKFLDAFIVEDLDSVKSYILQDFIIPGIKNLFIDTLQMMLWGETRGNAPRVGQTAGKVSYSKMYSGGSSMRRDTRKDEGSREYDYDSLITFSTKGEAELVLDSLLEVIDTYGVASVADLYDLSEVDSQKWTDNKYGWTDLSKASTRRTRDGYILVLPKAMPID